MVETIMEYRKYIIMYNILYNIKSFLNNNFIKQCFMF